MDMLGLNRYCCRRMVLTHVDLIEKLLRYDFNLSRMKTPMPNDTDLFCSYNPAERDIVRTQR